MLSSSSLRTAMETSKHSSFPRPARLSAWPQPISRPIPTLSLGRPPASTPPSLPPRPAVAPLPRGWSRTDHIIPAAYPRTFHASTGNLRRESHPFRFEHAEGGATREERAQRAKAETIAALTKRYDASEVGCDDTDQKGLWLAGERWARDIPGDKGDGVTLVVTHANGFMKESWHPTIHRLLDLGPIHTSSHFGKRATNNTSLHSYSDVQIDEIWLLDDLHHGASVDLNADLLGPVHNWTDGGRDIVNLLEHCLPPFGTTAESILPWTDGARSSIDRKIIGVGHSFGGNALVQAAHMRPGLFHALFLVEAMCPPSYIPRSSIATPVESWPAVYSALKRRAVWPTRSSAQTATSISPFFSTWHQDSREMWNKYALVPINPLEPEGPTQLATPPWAEACIFAEPESLARGWDNLKDLEIPVGFMMGNDPTFTLGETATSEMVWRPKNASNERMRDSGHLIVQEKPDELADALWRFIGTAGGVASPVDKARL